MFNYDAITYIPADDYSNTILVNVQLIFLNCICIIINSNTTPVIVQPFPEAFRKLSMKFKYNTCYCSTWNFRNQTFGTGFIQIQHLLLFNGHDMGFERAGFKNSNTTPVTVQLGQAEISRLICLIQIQHLLLFNQILRLYHLMMSHSNTTPVTVQLGSDPGNLCSHPFKYNACYCSTGICMLLFSS